MPRALPGYGFEEEGETKRFELSREKEDELQLLFEDLIEEGGVLAVRDILDLLADAAGFTGEIMLEEGKQAEIQGQINMGRSLVHTAESISRLARKIYQL